MSDPVESWILKYIGVVATSAMAGMGSAMGWFHKHKVTLEKKVEDAKRITDQRFEDLEAELRALHDHNTRQDLALQKIEIQQGYMDDKLDGFGESTSRRR